MRTNSSQGGAEFGDGDLVAACLGGNREAFAQIVARYQGLVASIAYNATGNLAQSEDLAQETFLVAWRHLAGLEEHGKLRAWLCGIARRVAANAVRRQLREPAQGAQALDKAMDAPAPGPMPAEHAISVEEENILWRSLERIPVTYREPLILFYREGESIERVADALDLTPEAARQRLSRGRKLLETQVASFVEGALRQSRPGRAFTANVMLLLPGPAASAGLATMSMTAAKSGATKAAAMLAGLASLAGFLPGGVGMYLGYRTEMEEADSELERRLVRQFYGILAATILLPVALIFLALRFREIAVAHTGIFTGMIMAIALSWAPGLILLLTILRRKLRVAEGNARLAATAVALECRSRAMWLGLPLFHLRLGGPPATRWQPVKAWIAVGDIAFGGLFAAGGAAVAPLCVGGLGLGVMVFGGFSAGALIYTGFGIGIWAVGGFVIGCWTMGGCAVATVASAGGVALAREFAQGGVAVAQHANDTVAQAYLTQSGFFRNACALVTTWLWPTMIAASIPSILLTAALRRKQRGNS